MKRILLLLAVIAGATWIFDERVDVMGYDLPERKPIERRTALDFVNDVNGGGSGRAGAITTATTATTASGQTLYYVGGNGCAVTTVSTTARPL